MSAGASQASIMASRSSSERGNPDRVQGNQEKRLRAFKFVAFGGLRKPNIFRLAAGGGAGAGR